MGFSDMRSTARSEQQVYVGTSELCRAILQVTEPSVSLRGYEESETLHKTDGTKNWENSK